MISIRLKVVSALFAAAALALTACQGPSTDDSQGESTPTTSATGDAGGETSAPADDATGATDGGAQAGTVTVGWNQPFFSYNYTSGNGHATANAIVTYLTKAQWAYYDTEMNFVQNTSFGTQELVSEDPFTVRMTVNEGATWSDGVPVTAADTLLDWAASSMHFNTIEGDAVEYDDDGNVQVSEDQVYFDAGDPHIALIEEVPTISEDGLSLDTVFSKPYSEWRYNFLEINLPAHVVAKRALGIDDPIEARDALVKAIQDSDTAALAKISHVWNTDFNFTALPTGDDAELLTSCGAFQIVEYVEGQYMTVQANPDFTWGPAPKVSEVIYRYNEDPMAQVQALKNGELDIIQPQVTVDVFTALQGADGIETLSGYDGTYEHIDLTFNNGGPFDPATYGGDEDKARAVRVAFLKALPRQEIVEKLIKPLQPEATSRDAFNVVPGAPSYDATIAENNSDQFVGSDSEGAAALLEEAGITTPIEVRFLYGKGNQRREQEYQLVYEAVEKAGFSLIDAGSPDWSTLLGGGTYDASLFGWASVSTAVNEPAANYVSDGQNNFGALANDRVDELYTQLQETDDPAEQQAINIEVEQILYNEGFGVPIFQFPAITAWNANKVSGVATVPVGSTVFENYWDWTLVG
ncbi:MAG: ABC transporter family substrate-binding protein [Bifidobacteriaceae bacterium]|jgi:peptide/nickel transport system substrate-binding protein|nr:ABC transporter family substrate-binding protein [Bifidobacteriaceae bacterium]